MSNASELFDDLQSPQDGKTPQQWLVEYCRDKLRGIERVHFDFKTKSDPSTFELNNDDKKNFAKAVSGFANGGGGVLIWGIEDTTADPQPISNIAQFVQRLSELAHVVTAPSVPGVDVVSVPGKCTR
jgi:Putative DNA-binding domain